MITLFGMEHSSNNASQEFTKFCYKAVKPLPDEKEITANGLRYMNDEAFMAFNYYIAEKDLSEVCMTHIFLIPCSYYQHFFLNSSFSGS